MGEDTYREAPSSRRRECVKCFEKEDLDSQQKHHQSGEKKIEATVIVAGKEMTFHGLEAFRFQRRHKSPKNVRCKERLGFIAAPQGNESTSNVTTENISVKPQRLSAV